MRRSSTVKKPMNSYKLNKEKCVLCYTEHTTQKGRAVVVEEFLHVVAPLPTKEMEMKGKGKGKSMRNAERFHASTLLEMPEARALMGFAVFFAVLFTVSRLFKLFKKIIQGENPKTLSPTRFKELRLNKIEKISHDTRRFTFALPSKKHILGLPIGQHITFKYEEEVQLPGGGRGLKDVLRSYTPTTGDECPGIVCFVIKIYFAGVNDRFPEGGKMTQYLESLKVGDSVLMRGPKGHMDYTHKQFTITKVNKPVVTRMVKSLGMIAGGTGITPMLQIIKQVLILDKKDKDTTISLLYANQTEDDILVRDELELLAKEYPNRFKLHYTLDRPPAKGWKYSSGFIDEKMIKENLPAAGEGVQILLCGPPPMLKFACYPNLEKLGFDKDKNIFAF